MSRSSRRDGLHNALDTVRIFFPQLFRSYRRSRAYARIAALPTEAFLGVADSYDHLASSCAGYPSGELIASVFRDLATRWRCRAPSRQITDDRGAA